MQDMRRYERLGWDEFVTSYFRWRQGEHVFIAAPTEVGKTTLVGHLINASHRENVVMFISKTHDDVFKKAQFKDWAIIREWPPPQFERKVLLWPKAKKGASIGEVVLQQRKIFGHALNEIFHELGWCVIFDEQHWLCDPKFLGLASENAALQHVGRSSGHTVVNLTQRPANIPVVTYSSASHAFVGATNRKEDIKRLSDLNRVNVAEVAANMETLSLHELIYLPTRIGSKRPVIIQAGRN